MVTIGCKSLCHNASMGFDSPHLHIIVIQLLTTIQTPITPYNTEYHETDLVTVRYTLTWIVIVNFIVVFELHS